MFVRERRTIDNYFLISVPKKVLIWEIKLLKAKHNRERFLLYDQVINSFEIYHCELLIFWGKQCKKCLKILFLFKLGDIFIALKFV